MNEINYSIIIQATYYYFHFDSFINISQNFFLYFNNKNFIYVAIPHGINGQE